MKDVERTSPPQSPSPSNGEGEAAAGGEVSPCGTAPSIFGRTAPDYWQQIKPLARQMRKASTPSEARLWEALRRNQVNGLHFRRQHSFGRFLVDFYCAKARLVIEVDGLIHLKTKEEDRIRQQYLESLGLTVLRFEDTAVMENLDGVLEAIRQFVGSRNQPVSIGPRESPSGAKRTSPNASPSPSTPVLSPVEGERGIEGVRL